MKKSEFKSFLKEEIISILSEEAPNEKSQKAYNAELEKTKQHHKDLGITEEEIAEALLSLNENEDVPVEYIEVAKLYLESKGHDSEVVPELTLKAMGRIIIDKFYDGDVEKAHHDLSNPESVESEESKKISQDLGITEEEINEELLSLNEDDSSSVEHIEIAKLYLESKGHDSSVVPEMTLRAMGKIITRKFYDGDVEKAHSDLSLDSKEEIESIEIDSKEEVSEAEGKDLSYDYEDIAQFYLEANDWKHSTDGLNLEAMGKIVTDKFYGGNIGEAYNDLMRKADTKGAKFKIGDKVTLNDGGEEMEVVLVFKLMSSKSPSYSVEKSDGEVVEYRETQLKLAESLNEEEMDDEEMDKAAAKGAKKGDSISKMATKLGETTREMKSLVKKYKDASEPEKSKLITRLKELTKIKKELESLLQ